MGHEHAGEVKLLVQCSQPAPQILAYPGVQRTERFIQQQNLRLHGQGPGQRDPLLLPAGQLRRVALGQMSQLDHFQQRTYALANLCRRGSLTGGQYIQAEGHVLRHGHMPEQRVMLEYEADPALADMQAGDVFAMEQDAPLVGCLQPGDDAQQGGLARP